MGLDIEAKFRYIIQKNLNFTFDINLIKKKKPATVRHNLAESAIVQLIPCNLANKEAEPSTRVQAKCGLQSQHLKGGGRPASGICVLNLNKDKSYKGSLAERTKE